jgi:hypothetical protein
MDLHLVQLRSAELQAEAAAHRRARSFRRPSPLVRLYTRLWWASRPRAVSWGPPPRAVHPT